jgi:hypothetical protein
MADKSRGKKPAPKRAVPLNDDALDRIAGGAQFNPKEFPITKFVPPKPS